MKLNDYNQTMRCIYIQKNSLNARVEGTRLLRICSKMQLFITNLMDCPSLCIRKKVTTKARLVTLQRHTTIGLNLLKLL